MSRSYKKHGVYKDKDRDYQKLGNRAFRSKSKAALRADKELPYDKSEVVDDYNVSDFRFWGKEFKRK